MAISAALGERRTVRVPAGTLEYRERGTGAALVFVHGVAVNGDLWRKMVPELAATHRCIALDVPLGGHSIALDGEPDLSLFGLARIVADFLEALDLSDVTIVGNDTGARCHRRSWAAIRSGSAGSCSPPATRSRTSRPRRSPTCPGSRACRPRSGWSDTRSGCGRFSGFRSPTAGPRREPIEPRIVYGSYLAGLLRGFDRPALVAWAGDDKFFPREHGRRLAELLPQGRFELVERSRTFIPEDNPSALVSLVTAG
jgi:pimeloyl-ACP methyl ester carboxylesterase